MSTATPAWCGVDVGTSGVRAVVVDADGHLLGSGARPLPAGRRAGARHEQDPTAWWAAVVTALSDAVGAAGAVDLQALALDATSGTVLVEGPDGRAFGPALMYDDARATVESTRVAEVGHDLWSALGYRVQPSWALPKVVWLLDHGEVAPGSRIVHQSDHLVRRLTGEAVATDTSHALKTGVDLRTGTWPVDVLHTLGVPAGVLPAVVSPGTRLGTVDATSAGATGLPTGLPVLAGMTDGCAAQLAVGAVAPGRWSSALGTTLVLKGVTTDLVRDAGGAVYSHRAPDGGGWWPGGASSTGAGSLRAAFPDATPADLDRLTAEAATLGAPGHVTFPLVGRGQRFPFVAPDAVGFGDPVDADPALRLSALCHGIAYVERLAYDVLAVAGADVSGEVAVSGGTAHNTWWTALRADVLGRPVVVPESTDAATGMAVLAAAAGGDLRTTAERMVRVARRHEPQPSDALERGYRRLVGALADRAWLPADLADAVLARRPEEVR